MYKAFFNMSKTPFSKDISESSLYIGQHFKELQGRLKTAAAERLFLVVTGDSGCGKTTAARWFVSSLDPARFVHFYISDSALSPRNFYYEILNQLGVRPRFFRGDAKRQMAQELSKIIEAHKTPVVTIDEAHLCDREMLTEIRFLLNFKMDSYSPMGLIILGQSELRENLKKSVYQAIAGRVELQYHLPSFDRAQTQDYIDSHLQYAGETRKIFTKEAIDAIFNYSGGLARKINRLASACLYYAPQAKKNTIDERLVALMIETELS